MSGGCQNRPIQLTEILNIPKFSVWQIRKNARSHAWIAWSEPTLKSTRKSGRHYSRVTQCVPAWPWPVQDVCRLLQVIYHRKPPSLYCVLVCYETDSQGFAGRTAACFFQHSPLSKRNKNKGVEEEDPLLLCQPYLKAKLSVKSLSSTRWGFVLIKNRKKVHITLPSSWVESSNSGCFAF